jgi:hypothetical protein
MRRSAAPRANGALDDAPVIVSSISSESLNGLSAETLERKLATLRSVPNTGALEDRGNGNPIDASLRLTNLRVNQHAPNPGTPPFSNARRSAFVVGLELHVNRDGPGMDDVNRIVVNVPDWPSVRPVYGDASNASVITILNKTGDTSTGSLADAGRTLTIENTEDITGLAARTYFPNKGNDEPDPNYSRSDLQAVNCLSPFGTVPPCAWQDKVAQGREFQLNVHYKTAGTQPLSIPLWLPSKDLPRAIDLYRNPSWLSPWPGLADYFNPNHPLSDSVPIVPVTFGENEFACPIQSASWWNVSGDGGFRIGVEHPGVINATRDAFDIVPKAPMTFIFSMNPADGVNGRYLMWNLDCGDGIRMTQAESFNVRRQ